MERGLQSHHKKCLTTMRKFSAGILAYRLIDGRLEVLLGHPGGPIWAHRDRGCWSIPKGEFDFTEETPLDAARREFTEETGFMPVGKFIELGVCAVSSAKTVYAFGLECAGLDAGKAKSNMVDMEWPPHSGQRVSFPEIDRCEWFGVAEAMIKILPGQQQFVVKLQESVVEE